MIYLASPYGCGDPLIQFCRYQLALLATIEMMNQGLHVYSPIVHNHYVNVFGGPESGWVGAFWHDYDLDMLRRCDSLIILKIKGWKESVGVTAETLFANENKIPIYVWDKPAIREVQSPYGDLFFNYLKEHYNEF